MNFFKGLNSLLTLLSLVMIYRYYWLSAIIFRINRHCRRLVRFDVNISVRHIVSSLEFWVEGTNSQKSSVL